jgi:hypothetical protein
MTHFTYTEYRTWSIVGHSTLAIGAVWTLLSGIDILSGNIVPTIIGLAIAALGTWLGWYAYEHLDPRYKDE